MVTFIVITEYYMTWVQRFKLFVGMIILASDCRCKFEFDPHNFDEDSIANDDNLDIATSQRTATTLNYQITV